MIIQDLPFSQGIGCFYSSFYIVAKYFNRNISSEYQFLKYNGMKLISNHKTIRSLKDLIISHSLFRKDIINYLNDNNIYNKLICFFSFEEFKNYAIECINRQKPVILTLNSKQLTHDAAFTNHINRLHTIIIYGYNQNGFLFFDSFVPTFPSTTYSGEIAFDSFKRNIFYRELYSVFDYSVEDFLLKIPSISEEELYSAYKSNIKIYLDNLEDLQSFAAFVKELNSAFTQKDIENNLKEVSFNITYRGIIPSRIIIRNLCERYNMTDCSQELEALINAWYRLSLLLIKYSYSPTVENLLKAGDKMNQLVQNEKSCMEKIYIR